MPNEESYTPEFSLKKFSLSLYLFIAPLTLSFSGDIQNYIMSLAQNSLSFPKYTDLGETWWDRVGKLACAQFLYTLLHPSQSRQLSSPCPLLARLSLVSPYREQVSWFMSPLWPEENWTLNLFLPSKPKMKYLLVGLCIVNHSNLHIMNKTKSFHLCSDVIDHGLGPFHEAHVVNKPLTTMTMYAVEMWSPLN